MVMGSCSRRDGWPVRFGTFLRFVYIYIYLGWGGVWWDINVLTTASLIYTTLSTHVPPTGTTLMMQHDATLTNGHDLVQVNHQAKQFAVNLKKAPKRGLSKVGGIQCLDRAWGVLKNGSQNN